MATSPRGPRFWGPPDLLSPPPPQRGDVAAVPGRRASQFLAQTGVLLPGLDELAERILDPGFLVRRAPGLHRPALLREHPEHVRTRVEPCQITPQAKHS